MEFDLEFSLVSNTPVVGCELQPKPKIKIDIHLPSPPKHTFKCKWYTSKKEYLCCVHSSKRGTVQCIDCVKYGIPVEKSYHCNTKCFRDDWKNHRERHLAASVDDSKSSLADDRIGYRYCEGSWPAFDSAFESGPESSETSTEGGESWIEISSSETYKPTLHDSGYKLKFQSQAVDCEGLPLTQTKVIVTDKIIIAPAPCPRQMIPVETGPCNDGTFSILTYNVLIDYNGLTHIYQYCPTWALTWEYRRQNLLREISGYNADILCLQEVQNDYFEDFFKPELSKLGYSVRYKMKASGLFTGKHSTDGCATFFRHDRFIEIKTSEIEFREFANLACQKLIQKQKKTARDYRLAKDNVAVMVKLKDKKNGAVFCVANTHIHAQPKDKDVKVWQVATLINELETFRESNNPVLVCADLNSLPGSAPHDLVVRGSVARDHEDLKDTSIAMFEHLKLYHEMRLVSAYSSILNNTNDILISKDQRDRMDPKTNEPIFTNFIPKFHGAIDYIFYSEEAFNVKSLLELVDLQSVKKDIALPSPYWSSDHIALMASFNIKQAAE